MWCKAGRTVAGAGSAYDDEDGGFSVGYNSYFGPSGMIFPYLTIGGDVQVAIGDVLLEADGTTVVTGLGFQPELLLAWWNNGGNGNGASYVGFGASDGTTQACVRGFYGYTGFTQKRILDTNAIAEGGGTASDWTTTASFDSDGFTLTSTGSAFTNIPFLYLAIRSSSATFKVGTETQKTSTGTRSTTGTGAKPNGLLLAGVCHATSDALQDGAYFTWGAASENDGVIDQGACWGAKDTGYGAGSGTINTGSKVIVHGAIGGTPTVSAQAELDSFDSDGFTLDWTTADGTARDFIYIAFMGSESRANGGNGDAIVCAHHIGDTPADGAQDTQTTALRVGFGGSVLNRGSGVATYSSWNGGFMGGGTTYSAQGVVVSGTAGQIQNWEIVGWLPLVTFTPQVIRAQYL